MMDQCNNSVTATATIEHLGNVTVSMSSQIQPQNEEEESTSSSSSSIDITVLVMGLIGVVANLLVCFIFVRHRPLLRRLPNYFLLNQSLLDMAAGLTLSITAILTGFNSTLSSQPSAATLLKCYLIDSRLMFFGIFMASVWNLAVLAVERYLEVAYPIWHRLSLTRCSTFYYICID